MDMLSISISITVYNIEKYVEKCILSILNQEFKDFELIIIDDGSTDNSSDICKRYEKIDERIIYIYQPNQGVSSARNLALDLSIGKYILMVDGDDHLESTMLGKLFNLCESNNADISTCMNCLVDEENKVVHTPMTGKKIYLLTNEEALFKLYDGKLTGFGVCNKLYKKGLFRETRFPIDRKFEDAAIQYRLMQQANKVIFTEERLYLYVIHSESMTRKNLVTYSENRLDIIKNFKEAMEFLIQTNTSKYVQDIVIADYYQSLRGLIVDIMRENKTVRKKSLKTVTNQITLWKRLFLKNPYISKRETYFIHLWSRLPKVTLAVYYLRSRLALNS